MTTEIKAAILVYISIVEQAEGERAGVRDQIAACRAEIQRRGWSFEEGSSTVDAEGQM